MKIRLTINGTPGEFDVEPGMILLDLLRASGFKSVKKGCDGASCGSCTVLMDGRAVLSCGILAAHANGCAIQTLEGLGSDLQLDPVQKAFLDGNAFQCGFCAPGLIMSTRELLDRYDSLSREQIRKHLSGNLCRCTGYEAQISAVEKLFEQRKGGVQDVREP